MTVSVSKLFFYKVFEDFGPSEISSKNMFFLNLFIDLGGNRELIGSFLDVFGELEGHTQGGKIFPHQFRIVSQPQKHNTALNKLIFWQNTRFFVFVLFLQNISRPPITKFVRQGANEKMPYGPDMRRGEWKSDKQKNKNAVVNNHQVPWAETGFPQAEIGSLGDPIGTHRDQYGSLGDQIGSIP